MNRLRLSEAETSIAVVGGGIIGLSIAWRLAQRGWHVTVFDKGRLGNEASWAGAGMLSPGGEVHRGSELAPMAVQSRRMYRAFVRELEQAAGIGIDYQECGALELAFSVGELEQLEGRAAYQSTLDIPSKPVSPTHVHSFWPRVQTDGLAGARFYPEDGIVNPRDVVAALREACLRLSVTLCEGCLIETLDCSRDSIGLNAAFGEKRFSAVVIASGAWSSSIQVSHVAPLPQAEPIKGHLLGYVQPSQTCSTIVRHGHTYLLQRNNGLLIAGSSEERVGFEREVDPHVAASLAGEAGRILPHLAETTPSEVWTGFRPGGEALYIGTWHSQRLYLAYGHYRNGILLAPVTAQRIADDITSNLGTP